MKLLVIIIFNILIIFCNCYINNNIEIRGPYNAGIYKINLNISSKYEFNLIFTYNGEYLAGTDKQFIIGYNFINYTSINIDHNQEFSEKFYIVIETKKNSSLVGKINLINYTVYKYTYLIYSLIIITLLSILITFRFIYENNYQEHNKSSV